MNVAERKSGRRRRAEPLRFERLPPPGTRRLVVAANRLPVRIEEEADALSVVSADGGLVTALGPLVRQRGGMWIGWPGVPGEQADRAGRYAAPLAGFARRAGYEVSALDLTVDEIRDYYAGFCNGVLWPLLHGFAPTDCLSERQWRAYRTVNQRFANEILDHLRPGDEVLVNDYHLLLVPGMLRARGVTQAVTCFIHTPVPPGELLERLPWCEAVIRSLLAADRVGFQTARDHRNFLSAVKCGARTVERHSGVYPISVDVDEFRQLASRPEVRRRTAAIRAGMDVQHLVLGVDRLDYTKGLLEKLAGFETLLEEVPSLLRKVCLTQLVIPSRESVPAYQRLRSQLERRVSEINGRFSERGWVPVHYRYGRWPREELVAQYCAADVGLVTPVRDGMNLVAKEFCVCQEEDRPGVLVLSRFAGAAAGLDSALVVHPQSARAIAESLRTALEMAPAERRRRMASMVRSIRDWDIYEWARRLLDGRAASGAPAVLPAAGFAAHTLPS